MRRIRLFSKKHGLKYAIVDDEDYSLLKSITWILSKERDHFYAVGYDKMLGKMVRMHRVIMGALDKEIVDHRDRNCLNNRKSNLRRCTNAENLQNRGKAKNNTTGYKGVAFHIRRETFNAQIVVNRKVIHLGSFQTKDQAALAYNNAAIRYHKEFAVLNKI